MIGYEMAIGGVAAETSGWTKLVLKWEHGSAQAD